MAKKLKSWTDEEKAIADEMQAEGEWSSEEIGAAIGRSAKAVRQYFYRASGQKESPRIVALPDCVDYRLSYDAERVARAMAGYRFGPGARVDASKAPIPAAMLLPQTQTFGGVASGW